MHRPRTARDSQRFHAGCRSGPARGPRRSGSPPGYGLWRTCPACFPSKSCRVSHSILRHRCAPLGWLPGYKWAQISRRASLDCSPFLKPLNKPRPQVKAIWLSRFCMTESSEMRLCQFLQHPQRSRGIQRVADEVPQRNQRSAGGFEAVHQGTGIEFHKPVALRHAVLGDVRVRIEMEIGGNRRAAGQVGLTAPWTAPRRWLPSWCARAGPALGRAPAAFRPGGSGRAVRVCPAPRLPGPPFWRAEGCTGDLSSAGWHSSIS